MKSFKQILEASQRRAKRIDASLFKEEEIIMKKAREAGIFNKDPELALRDLRTREYTDMAKLKASFGLEQMGHDVSRFDKLQRAKIDADFKDDSRVVRIADQLKERNPDRYEELSRYVKASVLPDQGKMIDDAVESLQFLQTMKASDEMIEAAKKRVDNISQRFEPIIHSAIGKAHSRDMRYLYKRW